MVRLALAVAPLALALVACRAGPKLISFPTAGGYVYGDLWGTGARGVVLAHGGRFDRESWTEQARTLERVGYRCLAIDFRGHGLSRVTREGGSPEDVKYDVLAAVRFLRRSGAAEVSVIGASFGGWAAAQAAVEAEPGEIDGLVLLAGSPIERPERMQGRKLFIVTRDDVRGEGIPRLPDIRNQYERAPGPKELLIVEGDAHGQFVFETDQGERVMAEILRFLRQVGDARAR
jgi:alpha/beta superfamily hydrolase